MKRRIAMLISVALIAAGFAATGAGWTWDEDTVSHVAGPHEGSDF